MKQKVIKLNPPVFNLQDRVGQKAGLRPYRKGGVRLEQQNIGDKVIVHNYGHGGGGVSVGYGYSQEAVNIFERENMIYPTNRGVAVIGSGYIGLFTAYILAQKGYSVTVYSDRFVSPSSLSTFDQESQFPITSQVAGGVWIPSWYEYNVNQKTKKLHEDCSRATFNFYKECMEKKKFRGISYKTVYQIPSIQEVKDCIPKDIDMKYEDVLVTFDGKHIIDTHSFKTILTEGDLFLPDLISELDRLKVNFIQRQFNSQDEVLKLQQKYIFNCTGLYSKELFNDQNVYSVKGELAVFQPNKDVDYFFIVDLENGDRLVLMPLTNGLTFGHYTLKDDYSHKPTKEVIDRISHNAYNYFKQFAPPKPSL